MNQLSHFYNVVFRFYQRSPLHLFGIYLVFSFESQTHRKETSNHTSIGFGSYRLLFVITFVLLLQWFVVVIVVVVICVCAVCLPSF